MKKTTKGTLAAAAAAVLLLGGGTSLAYWTASAEANGGVVTSGELALEYLSCDAAGWVHENGPADGQPVDLFVPGDIISKSCTFNVVAHGDNLKATLTAPTSVALSNGDATNTAVANVAVSYALDSATSFDADAALTGTQITESAADRTLTATFTVTFPFGNTTDTNTNAMQNWEAQFDALTITLDQVNAG